MVGTNSIADIWFFLILLSQLSAINSVWQLRFLVRYLTNIMQQSSTLCLLWIKTQFCSHHCTKISRLTGMLQEVLTIRRTILHLTDDTNKFRMQAMDTKVDCGALTNLNHLVLQLFLHLGNNLLDACRVDATVCDELVESQATGLTTDGVKSRNDNSLRRIVNDDLHTAGCFQRTDVTALTTNHTALDIVVINMEHTDTIFYSRFRSNSLNGLDDNLLCLRIGIEFCLINNLIDIGLGIGFGFILERLNQTCLCLISTQARKFLKLCTLLQLHLFQFFVLDSKHFLLIINACLLIIKVILTTTEFFLTLVQRYFTLLQTILTLLDVLIALLHFLFQLALLVQEFLLHFKQFFLLDYFGFLIGSLYHLVIFSLYYITENQVAHSDTHNERHDNGYNRN